jgi:hypothetical protein
VFHTIEFRAGFTADVAVSARQRLERVRIRKGTQVCVHLMPRIIETTQGPVETADICFEDGSVAHAVPFEVFRFVEQD